MGAMAALMAIPYATRAYDEVFVGYSNQSSVNYIYTTDATDSRFVCYETFMKIGDIYLMDDLFTYDETTTAQVDGYTVTTYRSTLTDKKKGVDKWVRTEDFYYDPETQLLMKDVTTYNYPDTVRLLLHDYTYDEEGRLTTSYESTGHSTASPLTYTYEDSLIIISNYALTYSDGSLFVATCDTISFEDGGRTLRNRNWGRGTSDVPLHFNFERVYTLDEYGDPIRCEEYRPDTAGVLRLSTTYDMVYDTETLMEQVMLPALPYTRLSIPYYHTHFVPYHKILSVTNSSLTGSGAATIEYSYRPWGSNPTTGIEAVETEREAGDATYSLLGQPVGASSRGVVVVRSADGTGRVVMRR